MVFILLEDALGGGGFGRERMRHLEGFRWKLSSFFERRFRREIMLGLWIRALKITRDKTKEHRIQTEMSFIGIEY